MPKDTNKPKVSFITPCYDDGDEIERFVGSVIDQDFTDWEMIIVNDGSTDGSKGVIDSLVQSDERIKAIHFEKNKGACVARNTGAKEAKGEIYTFLPADAFLYPGMLTNWVEQLDEYPDYDFVYGGYRITDKEHNPIPGLDLLFHEFDPYLLEVGNYIDGSFPIRAKTFWEVAELMGQEEGLWDKKIKSLQDWDFWLSVVKEGKRKGIYIQDIFFETTAPHKGGLSEDSANNWLKRLDQIKKKHNIPHRPLCVQSIGAGFHAKRIAYMLNADFQEMPSVKPHKYETIYSIGFYPQFAAHQDRVFMNNARNPEEGRSPCKKIVHYVGTDIWQLRKISLDGLEVWKEYLKNNIDEVLVEADFTQAELKDILGIEAKIVPLPPAKLFDVMPLPEKFSVACYMPRVNNAFYQPEAMQEVAKKLPNVQFKFFGDPMTVGRHKDIKNIEYVGYIDDMESFIKECSAIMRFPHHDGLPISVLEFILAGRYATLNVPVKDAFLAPKSDVPSIVKSIQLIKEKCEKEGVNQQGSDYWRKELDHDKYRKTMSELTGYDPKTYWENRAESWDVQANNMSVEYDKIKPFFDEIKPKTLLDLGCGNGRWIPKLLEWGLPKEGYFGTDISGKLIEICQKKFDDMKPSQFFMQRAEEFDTDGKVYDLIFSYTTLEHVLEKDIEDVVKRLKTGGKKLLLIEPTDFISRHYCRSHDYKKLFKIIKQKKLKDKMIYLCDLK